MVKNPPVNAGDLSWIPRLGRPPGKGNSNPFQYFGLGNPMKEPEGYSPWDGVAKRQT